MIERLFNNKPDVVRGLWGLMSSRARWEALWLTHDKFIIGVSGVVFDDSGKVLLLQHRFWPKGSWGLPSGYAQRGETFEETLVREVEEETNYQIEVGNLVSVMSGYKLRAEVTYVAKHEGGDLKLDFNEIIRAEFFSTTDLPETLLPSHRELIQVAVEMQNQGD